MRVLLVVIIVVGFASLDVVVILALTNMIGWLSVSSNVLFWILIIAVTLMAAGIVGLRWFNDTPLNG